MLKIAFLIHGKYVHRNKIISEVQTIFGEGYNCECQLTTRPGQFESLAHEAIRNETTHIICVGGDGSLNETMNGLMNAKSDPTLTQIIWNNIRVGLFPAGTGNDFAKTAHVSADLNELKDCIDKDSYKLFDLGNVELTTPAGERAQRYFVNILDVGIGGVIAQKLASSSKRWGATITYQSAVIRGLLTYKNQPIEVTADTFRHQGPVMGFIVANGKYFGGGMGVAPDALPDDGQFSTVVIGDISLWDYLMNLGKIKKCLKLDHPALKYMNAGSISVNSSVGGLPVDMDGEFAGFSPLKLQVVPKAVNFLCPR